MISFCNRVLGTEQMFMCVSRPRRFGKSMAAKMINAHYEKGIDTRDIFARRKLSQTENWDRYLNAFDVIRIDMASLITEHRDPEAALDFLEIKIIEELREPYPGVLDESDKTLATSLTKINNSLIEGIGGEKKIKFVIIIDEWDFFSGMHLITKD